LAQIAAHVLDRHAILDRERKVRLVDGRKHGRSILDQAGVQPVGEFALHLGRELFNRGFDFGAGAHGRNDAASDADGKPVVGGAATAFLRPCGTARVDFADPLDRDLGINLPVHFLWEEFADEFFVVRFQLRHIRRLVALRVEIVGIEL
jgi:hypothetical protein